MAEALQALEDLAAGSGAGASSSGCASSKANDGATEPAEPEGCGPLERRWRLLQMLVDEPGMGRVQICAEMEPLVEHLPAERRKVAVHLTLTALAFAGLAELRARSWFPTDAGTALVDRRRRA